MVTVHASPAQLGGLSFNIESDDRPGGTARIVVTAIGPHKISATGARAVLSRANTYLGGALSAAQVDTLVATAGGAPLSLTCVVVLCFLADRPGLVTGLAGGLQAPGAVVAS